MFSNKKIAYIFVSLGDEDKNIKKKEKLTFFEKFKKRFSKKEISLEKKETDIALLDKFMSSIYKYSDKKCFSFYLTQENSHEDFIKNIHACNADRFYVFPMQPQYNSNLNLIANFFSLNLLDDILEKFFWIKSYAQHPFFIKSLQKNLKSILKKNNLDQKDTTFLFLAKNTIDYTPLYPFECEITCQNTIKAFPYIEGILHFFSEKIHEINVNKMNKRKNVVIIPITTLIDNYKTKKTIEDLKNFLEKQKKQVFIPKFLNQNTYFIRSIFDIIDEKNFISNDMLLL